MIVNSISSDLKEHFEKLLPEGNYFYFSIPAYKDIETLKGLRNYILENNLTLLIDNSSEACRSLIDNLYEELIVKSCMPEKHIVLMSGDIDVQSNILKASVTFNKEPFRGYYYSYWEKITYNQFLKKSLDEINELFLIKEKRKTAKFKKLYLSLNRNPKHHRALLIGLLHSLKMLDKGYISFNELQLLRQDKKPKLFEELAKQENKIDKDTMMQSIWRSLIDPLLYMHRNNKEIVNVFSKKHEIECIPRLYCDDPDPLNPEEHEHISTQLNYFFENSLLSLLTETNFYSHYKNSKHKSHYLLIPNEGTRFVTEKIYKTMLFHHPFIILSVPNYLDALRQLGYKTFHPYIDESYDEEVDDSKRILMILNELQKIGNYTQEQIERFISDTMPICEHNFKMLTKTYT